MDNAGICITRANARVERPRVGNQQSASERRVSAERFVDGTASVLSHPARDPRRRESRERRVLHDDDRSRARGGAADHDEGACNCVASLDQQARAKLTSAVRDGRRYSSSGTRAGPMTAV